MTERECEACARLEAEKAQLASEYEQRLIEAGQTINALNHVVHRTGREAVHYKRQLEQAREEDPASEDVKELLHLWREEVKAGNKRVSVKASGPRGKVVKAAIKMKGKEECAHAILGWKLDAWYSKNTQDIEAILKDERTIERLAGLYREKRREHLSVVPQGPSDLPDMLTWIGWSQALRGHKVLQGKLRETMGWDPRWYDAFDIGWEAHADKTRSRIVFPVVDDMLDNDARLVNVLRWLPGRDVEGVSGRPGRLWPSVRDIPGNPVLWLVADPPNVVSARNLGLWAASVPLGETDYAWMQPLDRMRLVVCLGTGLRKEADRLAAALVTIAREVRVLDLDPKREEHYDLSGWLKAGNKAEALQAMAAAAPVVQALKKREAA